MNALLTSPRTSVNYNRETLGLVKQSRCRWQPANEAATPDHQSVPAARTRPDTCKAYKGEAQIAAPATTPQPPYYAVIFPSIRTGGDHGYGGTAAQMLELASKQPGFPGFETARQEIGISVSYWTTIEAIEEWKKNATHRQAQSRAQNWYSSFRVRVCRVEREYGF